MRVFVSGATGFIGRNLVEHLKKQKYLVLSPNENELDLRDDIAVKTYLKTNIVDCIIHCATTLREATNYPKDTCENNLRMFFNLEKFRKKSTKLINLGSGSEYSRNFWHKKMSECFFDEYIPKDSHSYAKYIISKYIHNNPKKNLISLRIFGIFGKYEDYRYKFISNAIAKNLLELPIIINQNVIYDYLYINDFLEIIEFFINNEPKKNVFNITPTKSIDLNTIANIINKISNSPSEIKVLNEGVGIEYSGDNSALMAEIGNFNFTEYDIAIKDLYNFYKKNKFALQTKDLKEDSFLTYAKELHSQYFRKIK